MFSLFGMIHMLQISLEEKLQITIFIENYHKFRSYFLDQFVFSAILIMTLW